MKPRDAKTERQELSLHSENHGVAEGWILIDGPKVHLHAQKEGEASTGSITMSRRGFNALIDWYNREQEDTPCP